MIEDIYPTKIHRIPLRNAGVVVHSPFPRSILKSGTTEFSSCGEKFITTQFDGRGPFTLSSKKDRNPRGDQTKESVACSSFLSLGELFIFVNQHIPDGEVWNVLDKQGKEMFIVNAM
jgi:hypothetical protein